MFDLNQPHMVFVGIAALTIPIVAIIGSTITKLYHLYLLHTTLRELNRRGQPIPPDLIKAVVTQDK